VFWVISVYFNLRNILPNSGTFPPGHPVYIYILCTPQTHSSSFLTQRTYSCSKFRCNIFIGVRIIKEMPGSVASGTPCIFTLLFCQNISRVEKEPAETVFPFTQVLVLCFNLQSMHFSSVLIRIMLLLVIFT